MKKPLNWPTTKEQSDYMRMRQAQNRRRSQHIPAEQWMAEKLRSSGYQWTRQARWGYRLFDFWCAEIGLAVEVDGPEHNDSRDAYRDRYNLQRSGIVVLRVKNFSESDAEAALQQIAVSERWLERRLKLGLVGKGKKGARRRWMENDQPTLWPAPHC